MRAIRWVWMLAVLLLVACGHSAPSLVGYARDPAPYVGDSELPAVQADGTLKPFPLVAPPNGLLLVYFGYTSCPDVCPTTLADLGRALDDVGEPSGQVQVAMITIDPEVDTPEILRGYLQSFVPDGVALHTDDDAQLRAVAGGFGADYGKETVEGTDEVFHTASVYAIDDGGELLLTWPFGTSASDLTADLRHLLDLVS